MEFVQAKSKQAKSAMKQVSLLEIRDEKTRMKVTPPQAVARRVSLPVNGKRGGTSKER